MFKIAASQGGSDIFLGTINEDEFLSLYPTFESLATQLNAITSSITNPGAINTTSNTTDGFTAVRVNKPTQEYMDWINDRYSGDNYASFREGCSRRRAYATQAYNLCLELLAFTQQDNILFRTFPDGVMQNNVSIDYVTGNFVRSIITPNGENGTATCEFKNSRYSTSYDPPNNFQYAWINNLLPYEENTLGERMLRLGLSYYIDLAWKEDPEDSIRYAKTIGGCFFQVMRTPVYNRNITTTAAIEESITIYRRVVSSSQNRVFVNDNFNVENVLWEGEDSDYPNTYPGGGNDKNIYPEDGESGKGTFDNTNDEVDFPPMPLWDATSTGFISLWNPTITEITALYGFLWDSDISTTLKKLFLEPMDAIISLAFFPVDPTNFPEKRNVTIGHVDTEIEMYAVQKQFVDFDFGTLQIDEYYGAAWDYSPYTQASIYLPYIGTQALDIDDVMNGTLHLKYRVDLLSGMCAAMLRVDRSRDGLQAVIYTWQGNCAMQVPITAGSARDFLNSIIQLGAMAGVSLAQPLAGAIDASMHKGEENYESPVMGNNWINPTIASFSALNVIGQKVRVQRGGRVDANAGVMSPQEAYIILNRPVSAIPRGWNEYAGYPSLKIKNLSTQKGYTEVAYIKLNGLEATSDEIMELDGMLKGGVIL